jgi:hypothetical protein
MKVLPCFKNKHSNSIRKEEKIKVKSDGKKGKRKKKREGLSWVRFL